ncbi:unnamed protein product [Gordionus sp. m RMFG-2023]|uniref:THO complex subunit 4-like n=1 Tax=Gordionus sp. m RMFG-2023 TaxID=3053472 RepID=UPI0030E18AA0
MADKIDMSLDDIIKSKRSMGRGRGRGRMQRGARGGVGNRRFVSQNNRRPRRNLPNSSMNGKWQHDMFNATNVSPKRNISRPNNVLLAGANSFTSMSGGPGKLLISNLDFGVTDSDIQELFGEFGPLLSAAVHYDRTGRSLGTADVIFERKLDGLQAIKKYNNVPLDGRPMNIQMATSDINLTSLDNDLSDNSIMMRTGNSPGNNRLKRLNNFSTRGGNMRGVLRRGRGVGYGGGRRRGGPAMKHTTAELDAELDTYNSQMDTM